jgi:hypothetical protein
MPLNPGLSTEVLLATADAGRVRFFFEGHHDVVSWLRARPGKSGLGVNHS